MTEGRNQSEETGRAAEEAARWLVRKRAEAEGGFDATAFSRWLDDSPENRREFEAAESLWDGLEPLRPSFTERKSRARGAVAVLAAIALLAGGAAGVVRSSHPADLYVAGKSHPRDIVLRDGSLVHLNADSVLVEEPGLRVRRYRLERGEAVFDVVHSDLFPFEVATRDGTVRDVGTRFDLRQEGEGFRLALFEGAARLTLADGRVRRTVRAGQMVTFGGAGAADAGQVDEAAMTAWRDGRFHFADASLDEVIPQLNRYRETPVLIGDPAVGRLRVSGQFDTTNVDGVLNAMQAVLPVVLHLDAQGRAVLALRPAGQK